MFISAAYEVPLIPSSARMKHDEPKNRVHWKATAIPNGHATKHKIASNKARSKKDFKRSKLFWSQP